MLAEVHDACPKHMRHGPCGGVAADDSCEVDAQLTCPYVDVEPATWSGFPPRARHPRMLPEPLPPAAPVARAEELRRLLGTRQVVIADFPARALDRDSVDACAKILRGAVDGVLWGDSGTARVQFPPAHRASMLQSRGLAGWIGVNCRDRNRVALEGELAGLADAGASAVHCVTGDHPVVGSRPDAAPVFDLDSTELAAVARASGHLVSVAESPASPSRDQRPARLLQKQAAGAEICFVNHAGGVEPVAQFIARSREIGVDLDFIPCVPVIVDADSARMITGFTSLALPHGYANTIADASDPRAAGESLAIELSREMLALPGVVGVNLSGGPGLGDERAFAESLARIATESVDPGVGA